MNDPLFFTHRSCSVTADFFRLGLAEVMVKLPANNTRITSSPIIPHPTQAHTGVLCSSNECYQAVAPFFSIRVGTEMQPETD